MTENNKVIEEYKNKKRLEEATFLIVVEMLSKQRTLLLERVRDWIEEYTGNFSYRELENDHAVLKRIIKNAEKRIDRAVNEIALGKKPLNEITIELDQLSGELMAINI